MKIGFVVHFFDFRNDVRKVVEQISRQHQVVIFARKEDAENIMSHVKGDIELRIVDEYVHTSRNIALNNLFRFFGKLPKSIQNFYLMEVLKISLNPVPVQKKAKRLLDLRMKLPQAISYDYYLNNLQYKKSTFIDDIDQFICFTDISDSYLLARLIREKKPVKVYVYSWDHPCKQTRYSNQVKYLVWNKGLKQDMAELQHIDPDRIIITGASQFAYVHQFLSIPKEKLANTFAFPYIYFGCAIGAPQLVKKEVEIIALISKVMQEVSPEVRLVVRPYPVMKNWEVYAPLKSLPNVMLDDGFRSKDLSVGEDFIMEKYSKIHFAQAFIHLGTTLGFEACFTDTPSVIIDFDYFQKDTDLLSIKNFVHQYQNEKYLMPEGYPNVIHTQEALSQFLKSVAVDKARFVDYNKAIRTTTPLKSFEEFANSLVNM